MTDFLQDSGTNGFIASPVNLMTTELNALASGASVLSSVGGTSGVFGPANLANAIFGMGYFKSGGSFTPILGQQLSCWFLPTPDGTNFETQVATASTTVPALSRSPDFVIPFDNAAFASGNLRYCAGRRIELPWENWKLLVQNTGTTALPATGNIITLGPVAVKY